MIDGNFPMTATQAKAVIVGLVVMGAFGAALFGGAIPGLKPNFSGPNVVYLEGQRYYSTTFFLATPLFPGNASAPQSVTFYNVTFELWVSNWNSPTGGLVHGNGTEANGTVYSFVLGISVNPPENTTLYISPDRAFAASWPGGPLAGFWVHLMVRT